MKDLVDVGKLWGSEPWPLALLESIYHFCSQLIMHKCFNQVFYQIVRSDSGNANLFWPLEWVRLIIAMSVLILVVLSKFLHAVQNYWVILLSTSCFKWMLWCSLSFIMCYDRTLKWRILTGNCRGRLDLKTSSGIFHPIVIFTLPSPAAHWSLPKISIGQSISE